MRKRGGKRAILWWLVGGVIVAAVSAFATAQIVGRSAPAPAPEITLAAAAHAVPHTPSSSFPDEMTFSVNDARTRLDLPELAWSAELAPGKIVETIAAGSCTPGAVERAGAEAKLAVFWAAGLRRLDGADSVQEISPGYVLSQWRSDGGTAWTMLTRPEAATLGCAKAVCASRAQVWACKVGS